MKRTHELHTDEYATERRELKDRVDSIVLILTGDPAYIEAHAQHLQTEAQQIAASTASRKMASDRERLSTGRVSAGR